MRTAAFLDRDGVINENRRYYVKSWHEFVFLPGALPSLRRLARMPFATIVISNQSAINRGLLSLSEVNDINERMVREVKEAGGRIDGIYICPHRPDEECDCRKPKPGLLCQAADELGIDLASSYLVGDALSDLEAARAAGCTPVLVLTGRGREELLKVGRSGLTGFLLAADLAESVDWILRFSDRHRSW